MNEPVKKNRKRYSSEFKDHVLSRIKKEGVAQVARLGYLSPEAFEFKKVV